MFLRASLLALVGSITLLAAAVACDCKPSPPPKEAYAKAAAVFTGKVLKVAPFREHSLAVTLQVKSIWKGIAEKEKEVVVITGTDDGNCGYKFTPGKTYLIYANESVRDEKRELSTGQCSRTKLLDTAAEDLMDLGKGK